MRATGRGEHIITTAVEHPATQSTCDQLADTGFRITRLPVGADGRLDPADLLGALEPGTILVSVMHANNEIGTLQPLADLAVLVRERGILLHTDAAQSLATVAVDVEGLGVDLLTAVGHKMYAPKGVAALYIRRDTPPLVPQLVGGGQEHGLRAATENVPGIVALGPPPRSLRPSAPPTRPASSRTANGYTASSRPRYPGCASTGRSPTGCPATSA